MSKLFVLQIPVVKSIAAGSREQCRYYGIFFYQEVGIDKMLAGWLSE